MCMLALTARRHLTARRSLLAAQRASPSPPSSAARRRSCGTTWSWRTTTPRCSGPTLTTSTRTPGRPTPRSSSPPPATPAAAWSSSPKSSSSCCPTRSASTAAARCAEGGGRSSCRLARRRRGASPRGQCGAPPSPTPAAARARTQVIGELVESCRGHDYTDLVMVHEHRGEPDGLVVCHLPYGPTAYFGIYNTVRREGLGDSTGLFPMLCAPCSVLCAEHALQAISGITARAASPRLTALRPRPLPLSSAGPAARPGREARGGDGVGGLPPPHPQQLHLQAGGARAEHHQGPLPRAQAGRQARHHLCKPGGERERERRRAARTCCCLRLLASSAGRPAAFGGG